MVPIAIVAIALAFLAVEMIIQAVEVRRGKDVYGFFTPDPSEKASQAPSNYSRMAASLDAFDIAPPANVFLHEGHTWAAIEKSGEAEIGVDSLARKAIGKIDGIELPKIGSQALRGKKLFSLKQGERAAEFVSPINGSVTEVNDSLESGDWVCKVSPRNLSDDLKVLKIADDGVKWIYSELSRLQELVAMQMPRLQTVGVTMQDGGLALENLLEALDDEAWEAFNEQFLNKS
jgi:glycine cleavage system H lipoate-binding protein